ncbi:MAG: hypothetical protein M3Y27_04785, partial [Acidobacteriota bacterium]|nr:hypothetical protein [Acidobacteriota bacterium]
VQCVMGLNGRCDFNARGAVTAEARANPLPALALTRGARHVTLLARGRALVTGAYFGRPNF